MINAVPNQPAQFNKGPVGNQPTASQPSMGGASTPPSKSKKNDKKFFGINMRAFWTVVGLTSFIVLAMAGVYISTIQRTKPGPVAPTAPESRPKAAEEKEANCTLYFDVAPETVTENDPQGSHDTVTCDKIAGWACDKDDYTQALTIQIYEGATKDNGGTLVAEVEANLDRGANSGVATACGGNSEHGFNFPIPEELVDGANRTFYTYAVNIGSGTDRLLNGSPKSVDTATCLADTTLSCTKSSYQDELANTAGTYTLDTAKKVFKSQDTVVYAIDVSTTITTEITLTDIVPTNMTFVDSNCGSGAYNSATNTLTCSNVGDQVIFRADIAASLADGTTIANTAQVAGGDQTASCNVSITISEEEPVEIYCGEVCNPDNDTCAEGHTCSTSTNTCVYNSCLVDGVNCDNERCVIVEPTPTPPAPIGCNDTCTTNSDCSSSSHICWNGTCRLDTNPNSATCTAPSNETQTIIRTRIVETPAQPGQPELPTVLPETGVIDEGIRILGAGFAALAIGGFLMLLL